MRPLCAPPASDRGLDQEAVEEDCKESGVPSNEPLRISGVQVLRV